MENAKSALEAAITCEPEEYCLSKIAQAEVNVECTTEVYNRYLKIFRADFPGVKPSDI